MELSELAQQILFGKSLEDKLARADVLTDNHPLRIEAPPEFPGRPQELGFAPRARSVKSTFPSRSRLDHEAGRGLVLHFFANHELLAMELMALALLRFPEAPLPFRMGLARTIFEEQAHLRLYQQRMTELGIAFGQLPVNGFFWTCMKSMRSPLEYVAQMSMTFEQANLDYSLHYEGVFRDLGDVITAEILRQVYLDEIGHVKHGISWFEKWRSPEDSQWGAYVKELRFPLTPSRAKGPMIAEAPRLAAGLTQDFIDELKIFSHSKGRPAAWFYFNPGCERELVHQRGALTLPAALEAVRRDLASLMMYIARHEDVVTVAKRPSRGYLNSMKALGFTIPEFVLSENAQLQPKDAMAHRQFGRFEPWGWSPESAQFFRPFKPLLRAVDDDADWPPFDFADSGLAPLFSKAFGVERMAKFREAHVDWAPLLGPADVVGKFHQEVASAVQHIEELADAGWSAAVIKAPFSASGRGLLVVKMREGIGAKDLRWLSTVVETHGGVVVEPWLQRVGDFSIQLNVEDDKAVQVIGIARLLCDDRGAYKGHIVCKPLAGFDSALKRAAHGDGGRTPTWFSVLEAAAYDVGKVLAQKGYRGPAGIDALAFRYQDTVCFKPIVEVNPRFTMGRVALGLGEHIARGLVGVWLHLSLKDVQKAGFSGCSALAEHLAVYAPPRRVTHGGSPFMSGGALCTNDPSHAEMILSVLVVERSLDKVRGVLKDTLGLSALAL